MEAPNPPGSDPNVVPFWAFTRFDILPLPSP